VSAGLRNDQGAYYPLKSTTTLGRSPENDVVLTEGALSREHALVEQRAGRWFIEDRGSRNGTLVNGERLPFGRSRPLRNGDRIVMGTVPFRFEIADDELDPERTQTIEIAIRPSRTTLTEYQILVLRYLAEPWREGAEPASNTEIAARLGTPNATGAVKATLRRIYAKLGLSDSPSVTKRRLLCETARERNLL